MSNLPIGIFDSGVGGLSVYKEIAKLLPNENIIYLADSQNCPYGTKPHNEIVNISVKNTEFLLKSKCKIIVVACNTATAAAIDVLRRKFSVPFIGMEPAIKTAAQSTLAGAIGVLATKGTFNGRLFKETSEKYAKNIKQIVQIGDGLVELVEQGKYNSNEAIPILKRNLQSMLDAGVDQIVLGCTHYPFLIERMREIVLDDIEIINPANAVALQAKNVLQRYKLLCRNNSQRIHRFYNTGSTTAIRLILNSMNVSALVKEISI